MPTPTVSRLTLADGPAYLVPIAGPSARPALEWIAARYTSAQVVADAARWIPGAVIVPQSVAAAYCHELADENGNPAQEVPACAGGPLADSLRALRAAIRADMAAGVLDSTGADGRGICPDCGAPTTHDESAGAYVHAYAVPGCYLAAIQ